MPSAGFRHAICAGMQKSKTGDEFSARPLFSSRCTSFHVAAHHEVAANLRDRSLRVEMTRSLEPLMPYQSKMPAGLLDSVGVQASTPEQQTLRFDRAEAVYGVAETLGIAAPALFAAVVY